MFYCINEKEKLRGSKDYNLGTYVASSLPITSREKYTKNKTKKKERRSVSCIDGNASLSDM